MIEWKSGKDTRSSYLIGSIESANMDVFCRPEGEWRIWIRQLKNGSWKSDIGLIDTLPLCLEEAEVKKVVTRILKDVLLTFVKELEKESTFLEESPVQEYENGTRKVDL